MIVGVTMVRDEADVIETTLCHLFAEGIDRIIVADNLSTDGTRELLEKVAADHDVVIMNDREPGYYQSAKMTRLAMMAAVQGATWVLPFDADEIWYANGGTIAEALKGCECDIVFASGWDHLPVFEGDGPPMYRMPWRRAHTQQLPKVAFRADERAVIGMGNHSVARPGVAASGILAYRHFQWRSFEQMFRKVRQGKAAYDATDLADTFGAHWRDLGSRTPEQLGEEWLRLCDPDGLVYDPAPIRA